MSRADERELNREVKLSGEQYVNALVAYHHAVKALEEAQYTVAIERRRVEEAHERNEAWLKRRARSYPHVGDAGIEHMRQAMTEMEQ